MTAADITATWIGLVAMLVVFSISTFVCAVLAVVVSYYGGDRAWFWTTAAVLSAGMVVLYAIEVYRIRSVEDNLPWILAGAFVWVSMMGIASPMDQLARFMADVRAANRIRAAVKQSRTER